MHSERSLAALGPRIESNDSGITMLADPALPCRVLIVDDDPNVVLRISTLLRSAGYEIHSAASGEDALRFLEANVCQIVLTDWHMPEMDGIALCRSLRLRNIDGYIYILMLSVRDSTSDIVAGLAAGADDYVVKSANSAEILARLEVGRRTTHLERSLRKRNEENRRMAVTDALTGVHNRRFLMRYLPRELEQSRRHKQPLAVISCDLDNFKRINDGFGHATGDEILQAFATLAAGAVRQGIDWVARAGGEEFVIVLPETGLQGASRAAQRLRAVLTAYPITTSSGPLSVTVSMGVTALETAQELREVSAPDLLRAADFYLFESKRTGRDRATVAAVGCAGSQSNHKSGGDRATH